MTIRVPGDSLPKRLAAFPMDLIGAFLNRGELLPPFSMRRFVGEARWQLRGEDFKLEGNRFVKKLVEDAGLLPESRVLDLGSGCGRLAIPLTKILGARGLYCGLELVPSLVAWCRNTISRRFPNFEFQVANVHNPLYNPSGSLPAEEFTFPFADSHFDLVVAISVFTHLTSPSVARYAAECGRVLKSGGHLFASFFLLDKDSRSPDGKMDFCFKMPDNEGAFAVDKDLPERAIAYHSDQLIPLFERHKLCLLPPIRWGRWAGAEHGYSWQDILIFQKR